MKQHNSDNEMFNCWSSIFFLHKRPKVFVTPPPPHTHTPTPIGKQNTWIAWEKLMKHALCRPMINLLPEPRMGIESAIVCLQLTDWRFGRNNNFSLSVRLFIWRASAATIHFGFLIARYWVNLPSVLWCTDHVGPRVVLCPWFQTIKGMQSSLMSVPIPFSNTW